jgi:D-3-phosphoglycerate dehydrogenase
MTRAWTLVMAAGTFTETQVEQEHLGARSASVRLASLTSPDEVARETADADAIIVTTNPLPKSLLEQMGPRVRIIGRAGVGLDAIDLAAAMALGIAVYHCPDYATQEVATHAVAMILAVNRVIVAGDQVARTEWTSWRKLAPVIPLHEQTVGVVGLGRIGRAVIDRLIPLVREVIAFDPYVSEAPPRVVLKPSLDALLAESDVVTLHLPLTPSSKKLIGAAQLSLMKPGAVLVNVSRGALVDENALAGMLNSERLGAAALDVLEPEPPVSGSPILTARHVLLSPHFAWYSASSERRARTITLDGLLAYLEGATPAAGRLAVVPEKPR